MKFSLAMALVISNPNVYVNGTMNQTNQSVEDTDTYELEKLASEDMLIIQGVGGVNKVVWHWWGGIVYLCDFTTDEIVQGKQDAAGLTALLIFLKVPAKLAAVISAGLILSARGLRHFNRYNRGVRVLFTWLPPQPRILRIEAQR